MSRMSLAVVLTLVGGSTPSVGDDQAHRVFIETSPFRYIIVENDLRDGADQILEVDAEKGTHRIVTVLMVLEAFSGRNVKRIFDYVSGRFSQPRRLSIRVYTSLEQIETPEEAGTPGQVLPRAADYDSANYERDGDSASSYYSLGLRSSKPRKVAVQSKARAK